MRKSITQPGKRRGWRVKTKILEEIKNMASVVSMKQLLEAGVHFGHQTRRWNPKMAQPAGVNEEHIAAGGFLADGVLRLLLGANEQEGLAILTELWSS